MDHGTIYVDIQVGLGGVLTCRGNDHVRPLADRNGVVDLNVEFALLVVPNLVHEVRLARVVWRRRFGLDRWHNTSINIRLFADVLVNVCRCGLHEALRRHDVDRLRSRGRRGHSGRTTRRVTHLLGDPVAPASNNAKKHIILPSPIAEIENVRIVGEILEIDPQGDGPEVAQVDRPSEFEFLSVSDAQKLVDAVEFERAGHWLVCEAEGRGLVNRQVPCGRDDEVLGIVDHVVNEPEPKDDAAVKQEEFLCFRGRIRVNHGTRSECLVLGRVTARFKRVGIDLKNATIANVTHVIVTAKFESLVRRGCAEPHGTETLGTAEGAGKKGVGCVSLTRHHATKVLVDAESLNIGIAREITGVPKVSSFLFGGVLANVAAARNAAGPERRIANRGDGFKALVEYLWIEYFQNGDHKQQAHSNP